MAKRAAPIVDARACVCVQLGNFVVVAAAVILVINVVIINTATTCTTMI